MFESLDILKQAHAMARHAGARQSSIARNIANADTPGYRPTDVAPFAEAYGAAEGGMALRQTRAGHIGPGGDNLALTERMARPVPGATSPNGNGVSLEAEMVKSAEVKNQHDMALSIYTTTMGILRTSLGRPR